MIKAIIGLGNPEPRFFFTRHNIGYLVVDKLAEHLGGSWREQDKLAVSSVRINETPIFLIKPLTYMNSSGDIAPWLAKKNITPADLLVVHDELELPFGQVNTKTGGSARGHNGLRSLIARLGPDFMRVRCGVDRPENREDVATYVLSNFSEEKSAVETMIDRAAQVCMQTIEISAQT